MPPKEFKFRFGFGFDPMQEAWNKVYSGETKITGSPIITVKPKVEEAAVPALAIARYAAPYIMSALAAGATFLPKDLSIEGMGDWIGNTKHDILSAMGYYGFPGKQRSGIPTREEILAYEHPTNLADNVMHSKMNRRLRSILNNRNRTRAVTDPNQTLENPNAEQNQEPSSQNTPENPNPKKPFWKSKLGKAIKNTGKGIGIWQGVGLLGDGLTNIAGYGKYGSDYVGGFPITSYSTPLGFGKLLFTSIADMNQASNTQKENKNEEKTDTVTDNEWDRQFKLLMDTNKEEADSIK